MKKSLRLLSLFLSLVMLVCMVPLGANAGTIISTVAIDDVAIPREGAIPGYYYSFDTNLISPAYDINDATTINGIEWVDKTEGNAIKPTETFIGGHTYRLNIYIYSNAEMKFDSKENLNITVNGEKATQFNTYNTDIYGYGNMVWLCYDFEVQHEHSWQETILEKASKEKSGIYIKKCSVCGEESGLISIPMVGDIVLDEEVDLHGLSYNTKNHFPAVTVYDEYDNELTIGLDYVLDYPISDAKVGTYEVTVRFIGNYEGEYTCRYSVHLAQPNVKAKVGVDRVALSWAKVPGAKFYRVYGMDLKTGKYTQLAKTTKTSYTRTGRKPGTEYAYAVRACFINKAGKEIRSPFNKEFDNVYACTLCKAPAPKAKVSGKTVTLKWAKVAGADFYKVYKYNSKTKKYSTLCITSNKVVTAKLTKQAKGTNYYLVRAFNHYGAGSQYSKKNLIKAIVR